jgi:pyruvate-formate lyase-activating enzyme
VNTHCGSGPGFIKGADSQRSWAWGDWSNRACSGCKNWDISEEQIKALVASGDAKRTMTFRSPVSGIVTEKKAVQGMRFMPGEALYQVSDLSAVWVVADVFEQDWDW